MRFKYLNRKSNTLNPIEKKAENLLELIEFIGTEHDFLNRLSIV